MIEILELLLIMMFTNKMPINKKSQLQYKVFNYAFVIIIAILLLVLLVKFISDFKEKQSQIAAEKLRKEIESTAKTIGFGDIEEKLLEVPEGTTEICFADLDHREDILKSPVLKRFPIMKNSIETGVRKNLFFISGKDVKQSSYIGDICFGHYPYYACFKVTRNLLHIFIEGRGRCALIIQEFIPCADAELYPTGKIKEALTIASFFIKLQIPETTFITFPGEETKICLEQLPPPEGTTETLLSEVHYLTPQGTTFSGDVTLTMLYYPELLPSEEAVNNIKIKYYENENWNLLNTEGHLNTGEDKISRRITTLYPVAVFGPDAPVAVITSPTEYFNIFDIDELILFDGSQSYDLDNDPITYSWDFKDGATSESSSILHSFSAPGEYKVELTVTDSDMLSDTATVNVIISSKNVKNMDMYDNNLFLMAYETQGLMNWQGILRLVPLTMWNSRDLTLIKYPYLVYYETGGSTADDFEDLLAGTGINYGGIVVFGEVPAGFDAMQETFENYLNYWTSFEDIVIVKDDENNKQAALTAAMYASFINAPLLLVSPAHREELDALISPAQIERVFIIGSMDSSIVNDITASIGEDNVHIYSIGEAKNHIPDAYSTLFSNIFASTT